MSHTPSAAQGRDEDILDLYFARDEQAIAETDRRYGPACMKLSMEILDSRPDAEECVNDTYLRTWNAIPPARPRSLLAYLLRIVRNLSVSRLRELCATRRARTATISLEELSECIPDRAYGDEELADSIAAFVHALPDIDRRLFVGRYWYNLPVKKLAAEWGITPNNATKILARTREKLRVHLEKGGFTV